jgi:diacylglycerol kinase (ATP)
VSEQVLKTDRVVILHNPKAGAEDVCRNVDLLGKILRRRQFNVEVLTDLGRSCTLANLLHGQGQLRALIGVGGDGTAAELVNRTCGGLPITMYPAGNENLLARYFGMKPSPEHIARTIEFGKTICTDVGMANNRVFLLMVSCGLDAEVVDTVHSQRKGHIRSRDYVKPLWNALRTYGYPKLNVYCEKEHNDNGKGCSGNNGKACMTASWISVFNLPCYGGGFRFAPQATGSDGCLDLCGFGSGGFWNTLKFMTAAYLGRHQRLNDWMTKKISRIRIESDVQVRYQLDGDPGGCLPLNIEVVPNRLTIIVPEIQVVSFK